MKTILVEDHVMFREVLHKLCVKDLGFIILGEASTGTEAEALISQNHPDLVILDLLLPDGDGFGVCDYMQKTIGAAKVLVVSAHCDDYTLYRLEKTVINGFIDKATASLDILRTALSIVAKGGSYFSDSYNEAKRQRKNGLVNFQKILTERECEFLSLVGRALSDGELAVTLGVTESSAQTYRSQIMRKLNISGTPKLIAFAIEHGFTKFVSRRGGSSFYI